MLWRGLLLLIVCPTTSVGLACSQECPKVPAKRISLSSWSTASLASSDQQWRFTGIGSRSPDEGAALFIRNTHTSKEWKVGSMDRSGTAFWSEDSKRLLLRDEYAADDTKIRVFDVSSSTPREINGVDPKIRKAIYAHVPDNGTTQWLYYPQVCFAANDSSTILLIADAPLVPKTESGSGKSFRLRLTVNLNTLDVVDSVSVKKKQPPLKKMP